MELNEFIKLLEGLTDLKYKVEGRKLIVYPPMKPIYKVIWNDSEISEVSDLSMDTWYLEGKWRPCHTYLSVAFEGKLKLSDSIQLMQKPETAPRVVLQNKLTLLIDYIV